MNRKGESVTYYDQPNQQAVQAEPPAGPDPDPEPEPEPEPDQPEQKAAKSKR